MATLGLLASTPDMLRLLVTSAGGEGTETVNITQAQLIAFTSPTGGGVLGPLHNLFVSPFSEPPPGPGAATWANLIKDARLSVSLTSYGVVTSESSYFFTTVSSQYVLQLLLELGALPTVLELRFQHSINR